jgi:hypothetical protein
VARRRVAGALTRVRVALLPRLARRAALAADAALGRRLRGVQYTLALGGAAPVDAGVRRCRAARHGHVERDLGLNIRPRVNRAVDDRTVTTTVGARVDTGVGGAPAALERQTATRRQGEHRSTDETRLTTERRLRRYQAMHAVIPASTRGRGSSGASPRVSSVVATRASRARRTSILAATWQ